MKVRWGHCLTTSTTDATTTTTTHVIQPEEEMNATDFFWLGKQLSATPPVASLSGNETIRGETVGDAQRRRGSRRRVFLLIALAVLKFVADQALPTFILLLSIQTGVNYVVLTLYSGHIVPRSMIDYALARTDGGTAVVWAVTAPSHVPPYQIGGTHDGWWSWWSSVVQVEFQSRSVGCLLYTITKDKLSDVGHEADAGHVWQIISAALPFA